LAKLRKDEIVTLHVLKEKGESNRAVAAGTASDSSTAARPTTKKGGRRLLLQTLSLRAFIIEPSSLGKGVAV